MTKEQFDIEMQKGMDDIAKGRVVSIDAVEDENMTVTVARIMYGGRDISKQLDPSDF